MDDSLYNKLIEFNKYLYNTNKPIWEINQVEMFANVIQHTENGLYIIDDVYIGKSNSLQRRIKEHIFSPCRGGHNQRLTDYITNKFKNNEKLNFKQISIDEDQESEFILEYCITHDLLNKEFMPKLEDLKRYREDDQNLLMKAKNAIDKESEIILQKLFENYSIKHEEMLLKEESEFKEKLSNILYIWYRGDRKTITMFVDDMLKNLTEYAHTLEINGTPFQLPKNLLD